MPTAISGTFHVYKHLWHIQCLQPFVAHTMPPAIAGNDHLSGWLRERFQVASFLSAVSDTVPEMANDTPGTYISFKQHCCATSDLI